MKQDTFSENFISTDSTPPLRHYRVTWLTLNQWERRKLKLSLNYEVQFYTYRIQSFRLDMHFINRSCKNYK